MRHKVVHKTFQEKVLENSHSKYHFSPFNTYQKEMERVRRSRSKLWRTP